MSHCIYYPDDPKPSAAEPSSKKGKKRKKGKKGKKEEEEVRTHRPMVNVSHGELPDGALASDEEQKEEEDMDDVARALNQNLDM